MVWSELMKRFVRRSVAQIKEYDFLRQAVFRLRTLSFSRRTAALGHAGQLIEAGNFNAAAEYLRGVDNKNLRVWHALLTSYLSAHRFEEACSTYDAMPDEARDDLECRHLVLVAAANRKRLDLVETIISGVLEEPASDGSAAFLSKIFLFSEALGGEKSRQVTDRIVAHRDWLAAEQFDVLLKCTHHLRAKGLECEAALLEETVRANAVDDRARMKIDILEAQNQFWNKRYDLQLAAVNRVLGNQGLAHISLLDETQPFQCSNLASTEQPDIQAGGPLISILMPAYNCASTIGYALASLARQTYRNIEVIVVDDASSDGTVQVARQFCSADPRFRLISLSQNSGAFVARNRALALAAGEYVTNQDSDDWAHPQKIASAVAELQRDSSLVATWVEHVRCSNQKGFRALNGYFRPDASSLMFRRQPVIEQIGWYDSVRAAGDGEFHLRMERNFGRRSIRQLRKLLSFVSWSDASLSGGGVFQIDSDLGLFSPVRSEYRRAFGYWHETAHRLYMPFPLEHRPFPAPKSLVSSAATPP